MIKSFRCCVSLLLLGLGGVPVSASTNALWNVQDDGRLNSTNYLQVEIKPASEHPFLLIDRADLAEVKRRAEAMPPHPEITPAPKMDPILRAFLYKDEALRKKVSADFMTDIRKNFGPPVNEIFAAKNPRSGLYYFRHFNDSMFYYDIIVSFGYLSKADQQEFEDDMARITKFVIGDNPTNFPSKATPKHNGLEGPNGFNEGNRWADQVMGSILFGLTFPEHPLSKAWVEYSVRQLRYLLDHGVWEGTWNEVPRYHDATMRILIGGFVALKRRTDIDFFQAPAVKGLLDWYVRFSSPLVRFPEAIKINPAGVPTMPVWGDSSFGNNAFSSLAVYAPQYAKTDPELAQRLMWMWRRAGSPIAGGSHFSTTFPMLADPTLPDAPQTLASDFCRTFGFVSLRAGFNTPDETWVTMRGGHQATGHGRMDLGSFDFFSHGIPLALGSMSGPYDPSIVWNQSQESNDDVVFKARSRQGGGREQSGRLEAFFTSPQIDYAVADCSRPLDRWVKPEDVFHWCRHLLLVKNPDYLVIWDEISATMPADWYLHTTGEKLIWSKHLITSKTAYNADLDIHVLSPSEPLVPNEKAGRFGTGNPKYLYPFTTLKYFNIPAKAGQDFLTVLHPRKPDGTPITTTLVASDKDMVSIKATHGNSTDRITLGKNGATFQRDTNPVITIPLAIQKTDNPFDSGDSIPASSLSD